MSRAGFIAVAGRPNVGKSTLVNQLVGSKVAVASDKPQTTRRAIRGIVNGESEGERYQLVLVDLPGVQRPRDTLTRRMQHRVDRELTDCDAALLVLNAAEQLGPGDRFIARALIAAKAPTLIAVNKTDVVGQSDTAETLFGAARLEDAGLNLHAVFPVSALTGDGVEALRDGLVSLAPEGPLPYPVEEVTDQPQQQLLAELIREQALRRVREEIPHAVEVEVSEIERRDDLTAVRALLLVETESQKKILVGRNGSMVKAIGTAARLELQRSLGNKVHLDLTVKVRRAWRSDEALLDRLGIEG
ncbi:MAG: GTPase Era [Solirubrobacterales bacterium]